MTAVTTGVMAAIASTLALTGTASATADAVSTPDRSGIQVVASGETADGGWVEYTGVGEVTVDGSADGPGAQAVKEVGGGTWSFGSGPNAIGQKSCYSQYRHYDVAHGSSVSMDGSTDSDWVGPGAVSSARVTMYTTEVCRAYWRK